MPTTGACTADVKVADGKKVTVSEVTNYPLRRKHRFHHYKGKAALPVLCAHTPMDPWAEVCVNGERVDARLMGGKYLVINREWKKGSRLTMRFPMHLSMRVWQVNKHSVSSRLWTAHPSL